MRNGAESIEWERGGTVWGRPETLERAERWVRTAERLGHSGETRGEKTDWRRVQRTWGKWTS